MMIRYRNEPPQLDIPPDKAAVIARLDEMKQGEWKALQSLSYAELDELEDEVDSSYVYQPRGTLIHPHNQMRLDGLSAIAAERGRRRHEWQRHEGEQYRRAQAIREACELLAEAAKRIDEIAVIEPDPEYFKVPSAPVLDVAAASDGELVTTARACRNIIEHSDPRSVADQAKAIGTVKGKTAVAVAASLAERADAMAKARDDSSALLEEIQAEQKRREDERRGRMEGMTNEGLDARVSELEKLLGSK